MSIADDEGGGVSSKNDSSQSFTKRTGRKRRTTKKDTIKKREADAGPKRVAVDEYWENEDDDFLGARWFLDDKNSEELMMNQDFFVDDDWDMDQDGLGYFLNDPQEDWRDDADFLMDFFSRNDGSGESNIPQDEALSNDELQLGILEHSLRHFVTTIGVTDWSTFFSLQGEFSLLGKNNRFALMAASSSDALNIHPKESNDPIKSRKQTTGSQRSEKPPSEGAEIRADGRRWARRLSSTTSWSEADEREFEDETNFLRNMAVRFISMYQLNYRSNAEEIQKDLLDIPFNKVANALSEPLLKLTEGTIEVMQFLPKLFRYLEEQENGQEADRPQESTLSIQNSDNDERHSYPSSSPLLDHLDGFEFLQQKLRPSTRTTDLDASESSWRVSQRKNRRGKKLKTQDEIKNNFEVSGVVDYSMKGTECDSEWDDE